MIKKIRVVLVDDHTLFRKGLAELLEHSGIISVIGIAGDNEKAMSMLRELQPDVVIMDLHMPSMDGITLLTQLQQEGLLFPTLILTVSDSQDDMISALRAGAHGYLLKNMEPAELVDAIQRASNGETVVASTMTAKLVKMLHTKEDKKNSPLEQLTQREQQVLDWLSKGESNKVIARNLGISHETVKLHVHNIFSKLNIKSRVEAAIFAVEHRLNLSSSDMPKS
jgi:two-component system nitrate/nitrite response regulator NarL